ncbi:MAG: histidine--tRNA ligase [Planctomycetota bacterium]|jgi:histidyl-tRNA synthetase|nr:MAG: histidine--tRNA ligase [Planctomycetota bacterium]
MIEPRTLKGFRDHLPAQALARERVLDIARRVYRSYGFAPIDTPALEYLEILTGKGSEETDKQLYRFQDHGGRDVGMRFDLTVPFARFAAQHLHDLGLPFKRYHMATVWRGENTQRGRYREFMQCDFDTIGTTSPVADLEMLLVVHDLLAAIGVERFTIRVNDRRVLAGILARLGLAERATSVLRSLDKLGKATPEAVAAELAGQGVAADAGAALLEMAGLSGPADDVLMRLESLVGGVEAGQCGVKALRGIVAGARDAGVAEGRIVIDPSIARGLDYYTGIVLESFLDDLPALGSICSGGRYDDLAGLYTKQPLPGVGASLGIDRLLAGLEELGRAATVETPAEVFLVYFDEAHLGDYLRIAAALRAGGMAVEFFPEPKRMGQQLKLASKRGFPAALVIGSDEFAAGTAQLKNLAAQQSQTIDWHGDLRVLVDAVHSCLESMREGR